jgi:hypothetical protein
MVGIIIKYVERWSVKTVPDTVELESHYINVSMISFIILQQIAWGI